MVTKRSSLSYLQLKETGSFRRLFASWVIITSGTMNVEPPALMAQMMDKRINSAVYVKVLK